MFVRENSFRHEIMAGWRVLDGVGERGRWWRQRWPSFPLWELQRARYSPAIPLSLLSSSKILRTLKSMLPLFGQTVHSDQSQCKEFLRPCPDGPFGINGFGYENGQGWLSPPLKKELPCFSLGQCVSKYHVKLAELCAIIQAFETTNVFVPSSTSANTSVFCRSQILLPAGSTLPAMVNREKDRGRKS